MYREIIHFDQENPQLVLEMLFRGPADAAHLDSDLCKRILLSYNAVYSVKMLDPLTPQTREIGVGLDLGMASVKELVNVFASIIQQSKGLLFFYAPYYSVATGAIGEFRWDRTKGGYQILHKATILDDPEQDTPEPMRLITIVSAALSDSKLHTTSFNITPSADPNEVLIAPY